MGKCNEDKSDHQSTPFVTDTIKNGAGERGIQPLTQVSGTSPEMCQLPQSVQQTGAKTIIPPTEDDGWLSH
jgi:hypothetical protein